MRATRIVTTMLTGALLLTASACQGDSPKPPPMTSTPVASPTPTPTPTAAALPDFTKWQDEPADIPVPAMPAAAKQHTKAGSVAFGKYYFEMLNYVILTADSGPAHALSASSCTLCRQLESRFTSIVAAKEQPISGILATAAILRVIRLFRSDGRRERSAVAR